MLFFFFKKKIAKGLDRTVLTGSCGSTPVLAVHKINKKFGSLGLKSWFHPGSQFSWSDLPVRSDFEKPCVKASMHLFASLRLNLRWEIYETSNLQLGVSRTHQTHLTCCHLNCRPIDPSTIAVSDSSIQ